MDREENSILSVNREKGEEYGQDRSGVKIIKL